MIQYPYLWLISVGNEVYPTEYRTRRAAHEEAKRLVEESPGTSARVLGVEAHYTSTLKAKRVK